MADNEKVHEVEHPKFGHEEHDVNVIAITKFGIGLTLTVMVSMFLLWGLFNYFKHQVQQAFGPEPVAGIGKDARKMPPEPRLQRTPRLDLQDVRAAEDQILNSYAVIDAGQGVVRIPVNRAIDILAQRGLPARTEAPSAAGSQNNLTDSGGGWVLQQPGGPLAPQLGTAKPAPPAAGGPEHAYPGDIGPLQRQSGTPRPAEPKGMTK